MAPWSIPVIKNLIRSVSMKEVKADSRRIMQLDTATKVGMNELASADAVIAVSANTREALVHRAETIRWGIVGGGVVLCLGLFLFGIRMTHRVAGPLHRIAAELPRLGEGRFGAPLWIRKGDVLAELYQQFREAIETLRKREENEIAVWQRTVAAASEDPALRDSETMRRLATRLREREDALG